MTCTLNISHPLPCCGDQITIGDMGGNHSGLYVVFHNLTTGAKTIKQFNTTANDAVIDVSDMSFPVNTPFEVTIMSDLGDASTVMPFTPDGASEAIESVQVRFEPLYDTDNDMVRVSSKIELQ